MKAKIAQAVICLALFACLLIFTAMSAGSETLDARTQPGTDSNHLGLSTPPTGQREIPLAGEPPFAYETVVTGYHLASGRGMAVDQNRNAYVIARTIGSGNDVLIVKLDLEGSVVWETYIDGSGIDYAEDIVVDALGDPYVTGWTDSEDFPITADALDDTLTGFRDAFIMKLSRHTGTILYSTYLGGDYTERGRGIALNAAGEIYIVGSTGSTDFPTTPDAYQAQPSFPLYFFTDAFITKLTAAGDSILYSTYFGGLTDDAAKKVALDDEGNIVFVGETDADDFPLANPIFSDPNTIFASKLSADGSTLQFSTYLGGEDIDILSGMAMDSLGFVYIAGSTRSVNFPTTPGAFEEDYVGAIRGCEVPFGQDVDCEDVFVTKLGTDGSGLIYSTYLGGTRVEEARDIAVDSVGRAYVVGHTNSVDFPPNGIDFGAENFVSRFNRDGSLLDYSVTVDSGSANQGHGVALDDLDDVYFTGAINVPADVYVAKLQNLATPDVTLSITSDMTQVPRNSNFVFDVEITNHEDTSQAMKVWTAARALPSGTMFEPLKGPATIVVEPGQTRSRNNIAQYVGNVPPGVYRYYARIGGDFPEPVWAQDYWDFEVIR